MLAAFMLGLLAGDPALGDGKVFSRGVATPPAIPDQQAIIAWDEKSGVESLAIETRFVAAKAGGNPSTPGTTYAWVIPLPGPEAPTITAATTGLFPTVREVFQPRVIDNASPFGLVFALSLACVLLLGVWVTKIQRTSPLISVLVLLAGFTCVSGVFLPTLGNARGSAGRPVIDGVEVLDRSIVGSYDTSVIGATGAPDSGAALVAWLKSEGFDAPPSVQPILADYAAEKWVFAAVKLRPDPGAAERAYLTPHPLVFTFKAKAPVYPMRLTGLGNGSLSLDLYVFGSQRAQAPGMTEVRCDKCVRGPDYEGEFNAWQRTGGTLAVAHPGLVQIVGSAPVATKLSGTLTPAQQARDMQIDWAPFRESGRVKHSARIAAYGAFEKGALLLCGLLVLLVIVGAAIKKDGGWVLRRAWWAGVPAVAAGLIVWSTTPTVPIIADGRSRLRERERRLIDFYDAIPRRVRGETTDPSKSPSLESVRTTAAEIAAEMKLDLREEDSPRNYRIVESATGIDLLIYNNFGAPTPWPVWEKEPK